MIMIYIYLFLKNAFLLLAIRFHIIFNDCFYLQTHEKYIAQVKKKLSSQAKY